MFHFFVLQFCSSFTVPRALCNSLNHSQINLFLLPKRMFRSGSCATYAQRTQLHTTTHIIWNEYRIIVIACIANSECYSFRCSQPKKVHTGQSSFRRKDKTIFWETFHGYDADFYCAHWIRYFSYCYCLLFMCVCANHRVGRQMLQLTRFICTRMSRCTYDTSHTCIYAVCMNIYSVCKSPMIRSRKAIERTANLSTFWIYICITFASVNVHRLASSEWSELFVYSCRRPCAYKLTFELMGRVSVVMKWKLECNLYVILFHRNETVTQFSAQTLG